jgi:hypothetical protein
MCGLAGFSGVSPNLLKLRTLLLFNNVRGKDSCGMYYNGTSLHGFNNKQYNANYSDSKDFLNHWIMSSPSKWKKKSPVIMHTRSKTQGESTLENAHPFYYYNSEKHKEYYQKEYLNPKSHSKNSVPIPLPDMVLAMNGSLEQLYDGSFVKEFNAKFTYGMNDSKMLGDLIFEHGLEAILPKYQGAAALSIAFPKEKEFDLILWSGASKDYEYSAMVRERPLHYYYDPEDKGIYYSSLQEHLHFISNNSKEVEIKEVPVNTLLYFKQGNIVKEVEIDRSKVINKYTFRHTTHANTDYENVYGYQDKPKKSKALNDGDYAKQASGNVYYSGGLFKRNGHRLSGVYYLNKKGVYTTTEKGGQAYYFVNGFMLEDSMAYDTYLKLKQINPSLYHDNLSDPVIIYGLLKTGIPFLATLLSYKVASKTISSDVSVICSPATTYVNIPFSYMDYVFKDGILILILDKDSSSNSLTVAYNKEEEKKDTLSLIKSYRLFLPCYPAIYFSSVNNWKKFFKLAFGYDYVEMEWEDIFNYYTETYAYVQDTLEDSCRIAMIEATSWGEFANKYMLKYGTEFDGNVSTMGNILSSNLVSMLIELGWYDLTYSQLDFRFQETFKIPLTYEDFLLRKIEFKNAYKDDNTKSVLDELNHLFNCSFVSLSLAINYWNTTYNNTVATRYGVVDKDKKYLFDKNLSVKENKENITKYYWEIKHDLDNESIPQVVQSFNLFHGTKFSTKTECEDWFNSQYNEFIETGYIYNWTQDPQYNKKNIEQLNDYSNPNKSTEVTSRWLGWNL